MKGFPHFAFANVKMIFRDRGAIFWSFLFPIVFMGLLGLGFGRTDAISFDLAVVDQDGTAWSHGLSELLENESLPFKVSGLNESATAHRALESGDLDLIVVIPRGFGDFMDNQTRPGGDRNLTANVTVYFGADPQGNSQVGFGVVREAITAFYRGSQGKPDSLGVAPESVNSRSLGYIDYLAPGILAMSVMQTGVYGLTFFLVSAREKKILKRLQATPLGASRLLLARILPALLICFLQAVILLAVAVLAFGVDVGGLPLVFLLVAVGAVVFICLGFLISSFARTIDSAESLIGVITMPMFFLGDVFIPVDRLPFPVNAISHGMPLTFFSHALRAVMIRGAGLGEVAVDLGVLGVFAIIVFFIAVKMFRWE